MFLEEKYFLKQFFKRKVPRQFLAFLEAKKKGTVRITVKSTLVLGGASREQITRRVKMIQMVKA